MVTAAANGPTLEGWLKQSHPVVDGFAVVEQLADAVNRLHSEGTHELHGVIAARDVGIREGYPANTVGKGTPSGPSENAELFKAMTESISVDAQVRATRLSKRQVGENRTGRHCHHAGE